jgi:hypothetical protein
MESFEHPINPGIRAEIDARLAGIEDEFDVRVLYACESGSRGGALPPLTAITMSASSTFIRCRGI